MAGKSAYLLILSVIFLVALGVVMLSSTSAFSTDAYADGADLYYYVKRQFFWVGVGLVVCVFFVALDYHWLERLAVPCYLLAAVLLALCFVPLVGESAGGASRWISGKAIGFAALRGQPSEFAKIAVVVMLAAWYAGSESRREKLLHGFAVPLLILALIVGLVGAEVDIGSAALIATGGLGVMFAAGVRWRYLGTMALVGVSSAAALAVAFQTSITMQNRMARIMAFMDLEAHKTGLGLQQWRALLAFGSGGI